MRPWAVGLTIVFVTAIATLTLAGYQAPWSPNFRAGPLPAHVIASRAPGVVKGARVFHDRACINCHLIDGYGGRRGPDLSRIGSVLDRDALIIRINNGGTNMPARMRAT